MWPHYANPWPHPFQGAVGEEKGMLAAPLRPPPTCWICEGAPLGPEAPRLAQGLGQGCCLRGALQGGGLGYWDGTEEDKPTVGRREGEEGGGLRGPKPPHLHGSPGPPALHLPICPTQRPSPRGSPPPMM